MTPLGRLIAEEIARDGPITVARYMELALAHPERGYYATRDPLGAAGDFVTAPEVSQMFGEIVGLWAAVVWETMGRPRPLVLAELGPGRGTLMADALRAGAAQGGFVESVDLHLVETSPSLEACQRARLAEYAPAFHGDPEELPAGPLILIANEFFDALPVRQLVRTEEGWAERTVDAATGAPVPFRFRGDGPPLSQLPPGLPDAAPGAIFETRPRAHAIAEGLGRRLAAGPGVALVFDYGHVEPALGDTLQAVRRHRFADPLDAPGEADLTAHVDFATLARAARGAGARVRGPVSQGRFLQDLGITERARKLLHSATPDQAAAIETALRRLIAPTEMGTLFKVMGFASPGLGTLPGFIPRL